ncbi:hypothetical protein [Streptomyces scabiei]|nr:hypothetical protein [Streptomyces scabiei]
MGNKYTKRYTEEFKRDAIALVDSPALHRRHKSAFISSGIPGRPNFAT